MHETGTVMDLAPRFAVNLRRARKAAGIAQVELSERCGLHRTEVSVLERGERAPRLGMIVKLASALDIGVGSLCAGMAWDEDAQRFVVEK
jgi:transcriptional regulator with XRE-family HTH domain